MGYPECGPFDRLRANGFISFVVSLSNHSVRVLDKRSATELLKEWGSERMLPAKTTIGGSICRIGDQ